MEASKIKGWRSFILIFSPAWFSINMGVGIVSIVLHNSPYQFDGLDVIAIVIFLFNVLLFLIFLALTLLRYILYPSSFIQMLNTPSQCLYVGTMPMGLATIINMIVLAVVPHFGDWAMWLAWSIWWIDTVLSLLSCIFIPLVMIYKHTQTIQKMLATWLLPIIPGIVASASGSVVATVLSPHNAIITIFLSYFMWSIGMFLTVLILALYLQRLLLHRNPAAESIVSVILPLGPCGLGAFALIQLAIAGRKAHNDLAGPDFFLIIYYGSIIVGFLLWSFGTWWLLIAILSICHKLKSLRFNIGWWGLVFPFGTYTLATILLGHTTHLEFFKVLSAIYIILLCLIFIGVTFETVRNMINKKMFEPPVVQPSSSPSSSSPSPSSPSPSPDPSSPPLSSPSDGISLEEISTR